MAHEIGTLRALPNGESVFVGSSSGVFFINTVRRAFVHAAATHRNRVSGDNTSTPLTSLPSPEECIYGSEPHVDAVQPQNDGLGELPNHDTAKELVMTYFRTWHPLVPFLHGPTCLTELENLYARRSDTSGQRRKHQLAWAVIFQCLFNIAKLERPDLPTLGRAGFRSEEQLLNSLSSLSLKCDIESIQALLTAQLYFVAAMHLQAASSTGGIVLRSIYKSGLHRCPVRYSAFGATERDMRKRVFWSAYTLDRFTSQSLGHPLGIQDSDVDVCQPGLVELHEPVSTINGAQGGTSPEETILHLPANHPQRIPKSVHTTTEATEPTDAQEHSINQQEDEGAYQNSAIERSVAESTSQRRHQNQSVQAQFVRYSRLVGRVLETFHKSIHFRSTSARDVLLLKADIDAWGNSLPHPWLFHQPAPIGGASPGTDSLNQDVFFEVARQHLLLLVNRPSLSLKPTSAEFRHAIQVCIGASRSIIRILETHLNAGGSLFWPGQPSAVWMGGLIMVFACQLRLHSISNAISEILASLRVLKVITPRWSMAKNCHDVLSWLLECIQERTEGPPQPRTAAEQYDSRSSSRDQTMPRGEKRPRDDFVGPEYRRVRLSNRNSPSRGVAISEDHTQPSHPDTALFDTFGGNYRSTASATNMNPQPGPAMQYTDFASRFPASFMYQDSIQTAQQSGPRIAPPFIDARNEEWDDIWRTVPPNTHPPNYDVFDGAMWGSLLEMVDLNG
ncbi:hypothetical protein IQ07DRAFT_648393 [Pyrenochaeta sp. DS3sAY3a]|nr:hypothetical protein IQ07DRAFT_648393 [Pyrenochaeta sp. DS3sAY3a]